MTTTTNNNRRKLEGLPEHLPLRHIPHIKEVLRANHMPFHIPDNPYGFSFNCWGFVALNFGWEDSPRWIGGETMEYYLKIHTVSIAAEESRVGDIAVFRKWGRLEHTALVTHDLEVICHKPGSGELCIDSLANTCVSYGEVTYVRPKDSKLVEEKVEENS